MSFKAQFASLYGYYIYILKNPFKSFALNIIECIGILIQWSLRDINLIKIIKRTGINIIAAFAVICLVPRILKSRKKDMKKKSQKKKFFVFAYWHDPYWKQFAGAIVKISDLCSNLAGFGHDVTLFVPRYHFNKKIFLLKLQRFHFWIKLFSDLYLLISCLSWF